MADQETVTAFSPLLCECGHSVRAHGPRLGEEFHKRCWYCQCDEFVALAVNLDDEWVTSTRVAAELKVSPSWVRRHAVHLGGTRVAANRPWYFPLRLALLWGRRLMDLTGFGPTVIYRCARCRTETVVIRGRLGREYVDLDHMPGTCP